MATIQIKRSSGSGAPASLLAGEPAVDKDGHFYVGSSAGAAIHVGGPTTVFNPMTTLGDLLYGGASGAPTKLAGDTSNTRKFLREQSSGGVATAPAWDTLQAADIPSITASKVSDFDTQVRTSRLDQMTAPSVDLSLNSHKITSLADGTLSTDAATWGQVQALAQGLIWKSPGADARTTGTLPAYTYANGTNGSGATLTANANGALAAQDGVTLTVGQTLAVMNETGGSQAYNGLYTVTQVGDVSHPYILTRRTDMDIATEIKSATFNVIQGTTYAGTQWTVAGAGPWTVGTTAITFAQLSGPGDYTAGTNINISAARQISVTGQVAVANGGTGANTEAGARTNLGLGTIATQAANNVSISGGSISGITDLAVADGGTGASTAADARTNLGAAALGANTDITSLGGLTGTVKGMTDLQDSAGKKYLAFTATASAVNYLTTTNAAANNAVQLGATGTDNNVSLNLTTKGSGVVQINGNTALHTASTIDGGSY